MIFLNMVLMPIFELQCKDLIQGSFKDLNVKLGS